MSLEVWKDITDCKPYQVSTWGRVRNAETSDFLYQEKHDKGYMRVRLVVGGKRHHYKVHRLVAQAFVPNPEEKPQVNHKDGNNRNNSYTNLEWVTDEENKAHQYKLKAISEEEG